MEKRGGDGGAAKERRDRWQQCGKWVKRQQQDQVARWQGEGVEEEKRQLA